MAEEDDSQKTEEPTRKKLEETRKKGQVPLSREMNNWIMLLVGTIVIVALGGGMMIALADIMKTIMLQSPNIFLDMETSFVFMTNVFWDVVKVIAFPMLIFVIAAFLAPFVQIGPLFAPESIKPSWNKISPIQGFKRIFSMRSIMEFLKGIVKIGLIVIVAYVLLSPYYGSIDHLIGLPMITVLDELKFLFLRMMMGVLTILFFLAVIDVVYQRYEHMKKIRMSKQEIKDEYKQTEGDPHVKGRLRQLRQERARGRMMQAVPSADVVITNPTHYAIALKYDMEEMDAPVVVAKGLNETALRIRELAKENNIVIHEEPPLARALYDTAEIDQAIPEEHFRAVAKIISYVFRLKGKI